MCSVKYEFCASLACIYFREYRLKENFAKSTKIREKHIHAKISTLKEGRHYPNSNSMTSSKIKNNILKTILVRWCREQ